MHRLLALTLALLAAAPRLFGDAQPTIDFEDLLDGDVVGAHYTGLTFTGGTILTAAVSLNEFEYPPRSGSNIVSGDNGALSIRFATPITRFAGFFTHSSALTLQAFNTSNTLAGSSSSISSSNLALSGDPGSSPNELVQLSIPSGAAQIRITAANAGSFTLDDLSIELAVGTPPAITMQPTSLILTVTQTATFTVAASGAPAPTFQWQVSINGGSAWTDLTNASPYSGVTTATLAVTGVSAGLSGYQYRAVATNNLGTAASNAATLTVNGPPNPALVLDAPPNGSSTNPNFTVSGWAIDRGAGSGTGIDAVHVYIYPNGSSTSVFATAATYATARPDIGAAFGTAFTNSGFSAPVSGLAAGTYQITAFGHSTVTNSFSVAATVTVTVTTPVSRPVILLDGPQKNSTVGRTVTFAGWAIDRGASSETGMDAVHVWAYPSDGSAGQFVGAASYGLARPDIGAVFGSQFTNAGFRLSAVVQPPGTYRFVAFGHSTVANAFNTAVAADNVTVQSSNTNAVLLVDTPAYGSTTTRPFTVAGWAVDSGATSGPGIDFIDLWAFALNGAGTYLGPATYGQARPDIGSLFGDSRFTNSGFTFTVTSATLAAGTYDIVAFGRSTVTNAFTVARVVRVTVQ